MSNSLVPHVYLLATLDTKGAEADFLRQQLQAAGIRVILVDTGCLGSSDVQADVTSEQLFAAADRSRTELRDLRDRGVAVAQAALGATRLVKQAHDAGELQGVMAIGGSAGTTIGTAAMRALPLGVPKLMVSTLASGQVRPYVGDKDILMLNSVVDFAGLNRISRRILTTAGRAMAGMVQSHTPAVHSSPGDSPAVEASESTDRPLIAATMFGVTTPCVQQAKAVLEEAGYEVLVFHATGNGGQAMESLIEEGLIVGVLDITTTELADELVGGILSAGPNRLTAAGRTGVPQLVSVGALDMVNFGPRSTVPPQWNDRQFYEHNANVTLMRTTAEECQLLGAEIARKVAAATGPTVVMLPARGISAIDRAGQVFDDPNAREALFTAIKEHAGDVPVLELDCHINDAEFAVTAARNLLILIARRSQ
ncbi:MAG: Tm-1-like ATP-binding domain-containing protein [Planctomycetota bacterium]